MLDLVSSIIGARSVLTAKDRKQLLKNGRLARVRPGGGDSPDFRPVVKVHAPKANYIWLLSELDPDEPDIAFGLCDLGMGYPELGTVRVSELNFLRGVGMKVKRDPRFWPEKTLREYAEEARICGRALGRAPG
jgi:hypothetical protein